MKTAINKKLTIAIFAFIGALVGCQSEVDKCVSSLMKSVKYGNEKEKNDYEENFRLGCLRAQWEVVK